MNEMKPILEQGVLANFTSFSSLAFGKVIVKLHNLQVPGSKGVPLPWMKWYLSFNDDCWPTIVVWKASLSEKYMLKYATLGFPFISNFPPMNEMTPGVSLTMTEIKPILKQWLLPKYTSLRSFSCWKISAHLFNSKVSVYKGSPPMNEM